MTSTDTPRRTLPVLGAPIDVMGLGLCCVAVFKRRPEPAWVDRLVAQGFRMRNLPENPYAKT